MSLIKGVLLPNSFSKEFVWFFVGKWPWSPKICIFFYIYSCIILVRDMKMTFKLLLLSGKNLNVEAETQILKWFLTWKLGRQGWDQYGSITFCWNLNSFISFILNNSYPFTYIFWSTNSVHISWENAEK